MSNLKSYQAADDADKIPVWKTTKFYLNVFFVILKSFFLTVPEILSWIIQLILPIKPKSVKGQIALVTGGSNGIGKAIAMRLAQEGCIIAIANRNFAEGQKTAQEIREKFGVTVKAFKTDVSKHEDITRLKADVESTLGPVDILVNNAGLLALNISLLEGTEEDIQQIVDINLTAYFWTLRAFLPGMIERKRGHLVSVSSILSKFTICRSVAYIATKFGNDGLMNALYDDLCLNGQDEFIKLTTVYPALVTTQKNLITAIDTMASGMPRNDPDYVGDLIVKGILLNRRRFFVPPSSAIITWLNIFPDQVFKKAKLAFINLHNVKLYSEIRKKF